MSRFILLVSGLLVIAFNQVIVPASQLDTSITTSSPVSLFADDTCSGSCWYGLVPGKSIAQDVAAFFETTGKDIFCCLSILHSNEIGSQLDYVGDGSYSFYWKDLSRPNADLRGSNEIGIHDNIVDEMSIVMNDSVYLGEVISMLGQPDRIRYDNLYTKPNLILDYTRIPLRVTITGSERCTMQDIATHFWVDRVEYYSPRYVEEFQWSAGYGDLQLPDVPADIWEAWLNGGDDTPCNQVVRQLLALPTLTPTPTIIPARDLDLLPTFEALMAEDFQDCSLPCWWGFTPGKTTLDEIVDFAKRNDLNRQWKLSMYASSLTFQKYIELGERIVLDFLPTYYDPADNVEVSFGFDDENVLTLTRVQFKQPNEWLNSKANSVGMPQILSQLEEIPEVYISWGSNTVLSNFLVILVYRDRNSEIAYSFDLANDGSGNAVLGQLCLNLNRTVNITLMLNYFESDVEQLPTKMDAFRTPEDAFGISTQEFVDFFRENPAECLDISARQRVK
jgi:hypothetical protein